MDRLEKELGLTGQPRVVVVHEKNDGREHCHVVWSRIDLDKMRVISDSHNFRKHELVARELEREFGHERVQGAHIERDGKARPPRTPSHKEIQQGARTGVSPKQAREHLTALWQRADNGKAFAEGLAQSGWILARGDRRDFVAIDQKGGTHSLSRRIDGATAKMVRERLADLKAETLPSVAEARATQQARHAPEAVRQRTPTKTAAKIPARVPAHAPVTRAPEASKGKEPIRAAQGAARAAGGAVKTAGKILDGLASAFEGLLGGGASPRPSASAEASADRQEGQGRNPPPEHHALDAGAPLPPAEHEKAVQREAQQKSTRRQELLRDYGREIPQETEQDAKIERDQRNRGGGRERER